MAGAERNAIGTGASAERRLPIQFFALAEEAFSWPNYSCIPAAPPPPNYAMSWDGFVPYVIVWIQTRVLKLVKTTFNYRTWTYGTSFKQENRGKTSVSIELVSYPVIIVQRRSKEVTALWKWEVIHTNWPSAEPHRNPLAAHQLCYRSLTHTLGSQLFDSLW